MLLSQYEHTPLNPLASLNSSFIGTTFLGQWRPWLGASMGNGSMDMGFEGKGSLGKGALRAGAVGLA